MNLLQVANEIRLQTSGAGGHATIDDTGATILGVSNVGGNLTVTAAAGNLSDNGAIAVRFPLR